jgi:hypothetical protein
VYPKEVAADENEPAVTGRNANVTVSNGHSQHLVIPGTAIDSGD